MIAWLSREIHYLMNGTEPPLEYILLGVAGIMFLTWAWAYVLILIKCFRQKTYGIPMLCIFLNFSWEATYSFAAPANYPELLRLGNHLWVVPDTLLLLQVFLYGRQAQQTEIMKKAFYPIATGLLVFSFLAIWTFRTYANDPYGTVAAFILAAIVALLYVPFFYARPDSAGLSLEAAWLMLIGNVAAAIFCYYWWPLQFTIGRLTGEPQSYAFLYLLYGFVPIVNAVYIWLLHDRKRRGATPADAGMEPANAS